MAADGTFPDDPLAAELERRLHDQSAATRVRCREMLLAGATFTAIAFELGFSIHRLRGLRPRPQRQPPAPKEVARKSVPLSPYGQAEVARRQALAQRADALLAAVGLPALQRHVDVPRAVLSRRVPAHRRLVLPPPVVKRERIPSLDEPPPFEFERKD